MNQLRKNYIKHCEGDCIANSSYTKKTKSKKTISHTKLPLPLVKREKKGYFVLDYWNSFTYVYAQHKVWVKCTQCQTFARVKQCEIEWLSQMHVL